jgi:hypothetical protein
MIGTLVFLFSLHRRQRESEREKRLQYWREQVKALFVPSPSPLTHTYYHLQNAFRQNIIQMHETAQASIFLNPSDASRRSVMFGGTTEDSNAPMMQYGAPSSGLRQYVSEDGSYEDDNERLVMRTPYTHDNKI